MPIATLVRELTRQLGRNVLDKTGLTGNFDFTVKWTPDPSRPSMGINGSPAPDNGSSSESPESSAILTAVQEQLGLKLEPHR